MPATWKLLNRSVGDGGSNRYRDVLGFQQLLKAAGQNPGPVDGKWGSKTRNALYRFETGEESDAPLPYNPVIEPESDLPVKIAQKAKITISLPKKKGIAGVKQMHQFFRDNKTPYNDGAQNGQGNRAMYGVGGNRSFGIQRAGKKIEDKQVMQFGGRLEMDCTTYVNLMLAIYLKGTIHTKPYDALCGDFGGSSKIHCARDRYGFDLVKRKGENKDYGAFKTLEQLNNVLENDNNHLYVLEVGRGKGNPVKHMAIFYDKEIYECTTGQPESGACIKRSLAAFMKSKGNSIIYLFKEPN